MCARKMQWPGKGHERSIELVKEVAAMFRCFFVADFSPFGEKLGKSANVGIIPRIQWKHLINSNTWLSRLEDTQMPIQKASKK